MKKNLAILTTAILDIECIQASQTSLIDRIISKNSEYNFYQYIHLDNHLRKNPRYRGTKEEIFDFYAKSIADHKNIEITLLSPAGRNGIIKAAYHLFNEFLKSECEYCLIFEDDTTLNRDIPLDDVFEQIEDKENDIIHFSFAVDANKDLSGSVEKTFIFGEPKITKIFETYTRKYSEKPGMTWNGTFFSKAFIGRLLKHYKKDVVDEKMYPEDQISRFVASTMPDARIKTLFFNKEDEEYKKIEVWEGPIPRSKHIIFDEIRWAGGRTRALW
jgi:hypothetical protein